ncbi:MAG: EcsC family protein [Pseudomonadota bacterium]
MAEKTQTETTEVVIAGLSKQETADLRWAYQHLEHPSLAARLSDVLAVPIEEGLSLLPKGWRRRLDRTAETSIYRSLKLAVGSMDLIAPAKSHNLLHKFLVSGIGAAGGFFGPLTLLAELPVTTTLILRSIADIAHAEGEDLTIRETRMACVQVFALGGRTKEDNAAELGYYGLRITMGLYFERDILDYAANAQGSHIPAAIEIVRSIAARFGMVISDKAAAQMVPIAGALSGAMLNLIFMSHYQDVAKGHFIVRRLERTHGVKKIKEAYQRLIDEETEAEKEFSPVEGW